MKYILSFLFICVAVQCIQADKDRLKLLKKMRKTVSTVKNMVEKAKEEKMRKLQQSTDGPEKTVPEDVPSNSSEADGPQSLDNVPNVPAVSPGEGNSTTTSEIIVKKFHNFEQQSDGIQFRVFISFLKRKITRTVTLKILATYSSGKLRILPQKTNAAGALIPANCVILNQFQNLVDKEGTGQNIDYDCTGKTPDDAGKINKAVIDTTSPILVGTDSVPVNEIYFTKESEVENIADDTRVAIILDDVTVTTEDNKIILNGYATPIEDVRNKLHKGGKRNMAFYDTSSHSMKTLPCTVTEVKDGVGHSLPCTLECSTESTPIRTYIGNLTEAKIDDNDLYLRVNPDLTKQNANYIINPTGGSDGDNRSYYRRSSSGLSGGAIAGIVIACVVVLAAASIAALMLRKTDPTVDQTTVVKLRPYENA